MITINVMKTVTKDAYMPWKSRKGINIELGEVVNMRVGRGDIDVGSQSMNRDPTNEKRCLEWKQKCEQRC